MNKRLTDLTVNQLKPKQLELVTKLRKIEAEGHKNQSKMDKLQEKRVELLLQVEIHLSKIDKLQEKRYLIETKFNEISKQLNTNEIILGYNFDDSQC